MSKLHRIREFDSFTRKVHIDADGFKELPEDIFDRLERFILENRELKDEEGAPWEFFSISVKRGQKVISPKNYVGLITMADGTMIEIMPKIDDAGEEETKRIFLDMLRAVDDVPYKVSTDATVQTANLPLYEVFMRAFLDEVSQLVKKGLKFGYVPKESSEPFLKGRMDFNKQIRHNLLHKEKFYVCYDEFEANRPENRLIKSTLGYIWKNSHDSKNRRTCRRLISMMEEIEESENYEADFSKYTANRNMQEYDTIIKWCRIFLMNKSFSTFHGKEVAFALLFPMERLFESYVAKCLKRSMNPRQFKVSTQDKGYYLFDEPKRQFSLRPDIVVNMNDTGKRVVMDTKWKRLSTAAPSNYGISQSDMYQMYAYHKKYQPEKVVLIYPYNQQIPDPEIVISYTANDENVVPVRVQATFFNLQRTNESVKRIQALIDANIYG